MTRYATLFLFLAFVAVPVLARAGEADDLQRQIDYLKQTTNDLERQGDQKAVTTEITMMRSWLDNAWTLAMGTHFHDVAAGTATPKSYEFAWNDQVISLNQFAGVLSSATETVAAALNTQTVGTPVVVFNALNVAREDIVEAQVDLPAGTLLSTAHTAALLKNPAAYQPFACEEVGRAPEDFAVGKHSGSAGVQSLLAASGVSMRSAPAAKLPKVHAGSRCCRR